MIKSPADITHGDKASKLVQRTIDVMLEQELFGRFILASFPPRSQTTFTYDKDVSFVEQAAYEKNKTDFTKFNPRMVPFYTRAKESIVHLLIPEIAKQGLCVQVVDSGSWSSVHIVANANTATVISDAIHEEYTMAVSLAVIKAVIRNPTQLSNKFSTTMAFIGR